MPSLQWDVDKVLALFGGAEDLMAAFERQGYEPPSRNMLYMWKHRKRIPGDWSASFVRVATLNDLNLNTCILKKEDTDDLFY